MFSGIAIDGPAKGKFLKSPYVIRELVMINSLPDRDGPPSYDYTTYRHFIDVSGNHYWTCEQGNVK